jgi:phosphoglycolate phosphatase
MPFAAGLFDLDGTLVDTRQDLAAGVNLLLADLDFDPLPIATVMSFVGGGARLLIRRTLDRVDPEGRIARNDPTLRRFLEHYWRVILDTSVPFPGVVEGLRKLQDAGIPMAVVSNKPVEPTVHIVQQLGLTRFFGPVLGGDSLPSKKPDPAGLLGCARGFGVAPASCLMVGDSDVDVLAAHAAGMRAAWCSWGGIHPERPEGPDFDVHRFDEVVELILDR